jgi:hypothetical protein
MPCDLISFTARYGVHDRRHRESPHFPHDANLRIGSLIKRIKNEAGRRSEDAIITTTSALLPRVRKDTFS